MINWKVRIKSKEFWVGVVGALGTATMAICGALGVQFDAQPWVAALTSVISGVFGVLALVGVVNDPTVQGLGDSRAAMSREVPTPKEAK